ncbi:RED-like protein N-terminal region-domain-containing protein [Pilobolus umbonatus]|nr:RED-like protein N-terminal region-domain-containing protein [Pilobolus umbonatus]
MATPRQPATNDQQSRIKPLAPKAQRNTGAIFAKPHSVRKKFAKNKKDSLDEEETEKLTSTYRDRAAERRLQENDTNVDESQLTTEDLGGDVDHTHLVKGLDYALLKRVRSKHTKEHTETGQKSSDEEKEMDTDQQREVDEALDKFERGEALHNEEEKEDKSHFNSVMAKNIYSEVTRQELYYNHPTHNELFEPGRMAYVFELADEIGHYTDAFAIPTALIRSKADVANKLSKSGWSEDSQAESALVIDKISTVMTSLRKGERGQKIASNTIKKSLTNQPVAVVDDVFIGDIFDDVGRDYELDEKSVEQKEMGTKTNNYFHGLVEEEEEEDIEMTEAGNTVTALLSQIAQEDKMGLKDELKESAAKRRKFEGDIMDADAADIDMYGLSTSALPTSFEEHQSTTAYNSDDQDDESEEKRTQLVDQGTNRNKKAQLTRWDFETEAEWQKYKDTVEIHPKSAFQFGVKLSDGRKRNRERKGINDKQRLDRDYQQVKNIMSKKYGKSWDE